MAAKNGPPYFQSLKTFLMRHHLWLYLALISLAFVMLLGSYGLTFDEPENIGIGHKHLNFYLTGHLDYTDSLPQVINHPDIYNVFVREYPSHQWPLPNLLSAVSCTIFFQYLGWLSPLDAHHLSNLIFVLLLIASVYSFVRRQFGILPAFLSTLLILFTPRLFADFFNNPKDIPSLALFSASLFLFYTWLHQARQKHLFLFILTIFLSTATKPDVIYLFPIVGLYSLFNLSELKKLITRRQIIAAVFSLVIGSAILWLLFPNLLPVGFNSINQYQLHLRWELNLIVSYILYIGSDAHEGFNLYLPFNLLITTPLPALILYLAGIIYALIRRSPVYQLLLIWILVISIRHSFPGANHYNGVRHFLTLYVPLSILAAALLADLYRLYPKVGAILISLVLFTQAYAVFSIHPYQVTYFNSLVGGLGGAQKSFIPESHDYWLSSYRQAVDWLNANTSDQTAVTAAVRPDLLLAYPLRSGLTLSLDSSASGYFITRDLTPYPHLVYRQFSQGGVIYTIYKRP